MSEPPALPGPNPPNPPDKKTAGEAVPEAPPSSLSDSHSPGDTLDLPIKAPAGPVAKLPPTGSPAADAPAKAAPTAFGRYVVLKVLGSGAFGTVYLGHDNELDRPVAIKTHRTDRASPANFLPEARRVARLRHPGIVVVHDVGAQEDQVYIVSDYVQGITLKERLKQHAFSWQEAVRTVAALADAIGHAHAQRIVHRDIKPANIILTPDLKPILVDFGLGLDESEMQGQQRGAIAGTPAYMSPEQAAGQGHRIDGRTDIYALGVVLYEMLTGHVPFRSANTEELMRQVREDDPQPPRQIVPHIPKALEQICLKALAKRVNDRHTTAGDLAEELDRLLAGMKPADSQEASVAIPSTQTVTFAAPPPAASDSTRASDLAQKSSLHKAREAERRQLTLLTCSCDLFESAAFSENLDYEEQHDLLRSYQQLCDAVVKQYCGAVLQMTEQAILVCFGYPTAYEDAAARAVRTGLAILQALVGLREQLKRAKKISFTVSVAVALEKQFSTLVKNQPELLAHHFTEAGLVPQGIDYWTKAGLRSQERLANAEAANHLRRGLELLASLPDTPGRAGQELSLQIPLGTVLIASQGYATPEVGPIFARARELCVQIGQPQSLMAVLWGIWAWRVVREEFDPCLELADEIMKLAEDQKDDGMRMEARFVPGLTLFYRGDFAKAQQHLQAGLALYDAKRCATWSRFTGQNSGVTSRSYLALSQWCLGFPDQALQTAQDAVKLARDIKHPYSLCYALHHLGWLEQHLRLGQAVQTSAEAELVIATEQGFPFWKATGTLCRAAGLLLQGKPAVALEQAQQGLTAFLATGAALSLCHYFSYVAEAHWKLGQFDEAVREIDAALTAAAKHHNDFFRAELHRLKGEIILAQAPANHAAAEACFQDSLAVALKQQAKSWELRTSMSLGKLMCQQGRQAQARQRLASVFGWFSEGFTTPDLVEAKRLLDAWA